VARAPRPYNGYVYIGGGHVGLREALGLVGDRRHISQAEVLLLAPTKKAAAERVAGLGFYRPELHLTSTWTAYLRLDEVGLVTEDPLFFAAFSVGPVVRVMPNSDVFVVGRFRLETGIQGRGIYAEPC
jgi:hypothetical protein